jgi:ABC transporter substrate binding protein
LRRRWTAAAAPRRRLVERRVDVIVAIAGTATRAVKRATTTIPIVINANLGLVSEGYVAYRRCDHGAHAHYLLAASVPFPTGR